MSLILNTHLELESFVSVVRGGAKVALHPEASERVEQARRYVENLLTKAEAVYGVNTGFGRFATVRIGPNDLQALQRNLLLSHAIGVGASFPTEVVRGMLLLRAQSLAQGYSGVRPVVIAYLLTFLNEGVHPIVPSQGSVGASGDLAPLAHMSLPLIGEGEVEHRGAIKPAKEVLDALELTPLVLEAKEGLALINGTQAMASMLALLVWDALILFRSADVAAAMSVEALKGSHRPFAEAVTRLRPRQGATTVAENMRRLLHNSELQASHIDCDKG